MTYPSAAEPLTVRRIVTTAIAIADADGLAAVSMRRIATELGAATMSLYRHVPSKHALIERMADQVGDSIPYPDPLPTGWRARLEVTAHRDMRMYQRHPWMLQVFADANPPASPNMLRDLEWCLHSIDGLGLDLDEMFWIHLTIGSYVHGHALLLANDSKETRENGVDVTGWWQHRSPSAPHGLDPVLYPTLSRYLKRGTPLKLAGSFDYGLQRVLDGIEAYIREHASAPDEPG